MGLPRLLRRQEIFQDRRILDLSLTLRVLRIVIDIIDDGQVLLDRHFITGQFFRDEIASRPQDDDFPLTIEGTAEITDRIELATDGLGFFQAPAVIPISYPGVTVKGRLRPLLGCRRRRHHERYRTGNEQDDTGCDGAGENFYDFSHTSSYTLKNDLKPNPKPFATKYELCISAYSNHDNERHKVPGYHPADSIL
ncbi:unknown [Acidaminococcus intestini CAG:325]|nr:unknown [Acidaminococcus intestini CAG:325]